MRDKAQEWLCREIRKTKIAQGQAESRSGVTKEELENLQAKVDVLDWLLEMIGCSSGSRWISVKERLPGIDAEVLIRTEEGLYDVAQFSGADRFWTLERNPSCWASAIGVTHWMPLPEPPKEERHEVD